MPSSLAEKLETILVVDDDEGVLGIVTAILKKAHFRVLSAHSGPAALKLAEDAGLRIHLLLSDLDMPELSGVALGQQLKKNRPDMRVMLMSGGIGGSLLVLNYGWAFIEKPFVAVKLVEMITNVLHSPDRSQRDGQGFDSSKDIR